jgi:CheY-like chemotaxis protein
MGQCPRVDRKVSAGKATADTRRRDFPRLCKAASSAHDGGMAFARFLSGVRVLVAHNNVALREAVQCWLELCGAEVFAAESSVAALRLLSKHRPNVLLAGMRLQDDDGCSLMRRVRGFQDDEMRRIPAIAFTADDQFATQAVEAGFDLHMTTTGDPMMMANAIFELARGRAQTTVPVSRKWTDSPRSLCEERTDFGS